MRRTPLDFGEVSSSGEPLGPNLGGSLSSVKLQASTILGAFKKHLTRRTNPDLVRLVLNKEEQRVPPIFGFSRICSTRRIRHVSGNPVSSEYAVLSSNMEDRAVTEKVIPWSSCIPSSAKNALAASRSSTTMRTLSIRSNFFAVIYYPVSIILLNLPSERPTL